MGCGVGERRWWGGRGGVEAAVVAVAVVAGQPPHRRRPLHPPPHHHHHHHPPRAVAEAEPERGFTLEEAFGAGDTRTQAKHRGRGRGKGKRGGGGGGGGKGGRRREGKDGGGSGNNNGNGNGIGGSQAGVGSPSRASMKKKSGGGGGGGGGGGAGSAAAPPSPGKRRSQKPLFKRPSKLGEKLRRADKADRGGVKPEDEGGRSKGAEGDDGDGLGNGNGYGNGYGSVNENDNGSGDSDSSSSAACSDSSPPPHSANNAGCAGTGSPGRSALGRNLQIWRLVPKADDNRRRWRREYDNGEVGYGEDFARSEQAERHFGVGARWADLERSCKDGGWGGGNGPKFDVAGGGAEDRELRLRFKHQQRVDYFPKSPADKIIDEAFKFICGMQPPSMEVEGMKWAKFMREIELFPKHEQRKANTHIDLAFARQVSKNKSGGGRGPARVIKIEGFKHALMEIASLRFPHYADANKAMNECLLNHVVMVKEINKACWREAKR